jgi:hypothetical protein
MALYDELLKANPGTFAYALEAGRLCVYTAMVVQQCVATEDPMPWYDQALHLLNATGFKGDEKKRVNNVRVLALVGRAACLATNERSIETVRDYQSAFQLDSKIREENLMPYAAAVARAREKMYQRLRGGRHGEAIADAEALGSIPDIPGEALYDIACIYGAVAGAEKDKNKRGQFETRCVESLKRAFAAGFGKDPIQKATGFREDPIEHMRGDKDLDSVRERDDFKKLIEDLARKP